MSARGSALSPFYGYGASVIAGWCGVSAATARRWKRRGAAPSAGRRLFSLHRDGKVLGSEWEGWKVAGGALVDPAGCRLTPRQLVAYVLIMQIAAEVTRADPKQAQRFHAILRQAA